MNRLAIDHTNLNEIAWTIPILESAVLRNELVQRVKQEHELELKV